MLNTILNHEDCISDLSFSFLKKDHYLCFPQITCNIKKNFSFPTKVAVKIKHFLMYIHPLFVRVKR